MMVSSNYERMAERARLKPNSTEAIAVIAVNDELRRRSSERRAAIWSSIRRFFCDRTANRAEQRG